MTTKFRELRDWQVSFEDDNRVVYQWHGWTIHCCDTGRGYLLAESYTSDGKFFNADLSGDVRWLAQRAEEWEGAR
jgi:hypothetical protein